MIQPGSLSTHGSSLPSKMEGSNLSLLYDSTLWVLSIGPMGPKPGKSVPAKFGSDLRASDFLPPGQLNREDYSVRKRKQVPRRGRGERPRGQGLGGFSEPQLQNLFLKASHLLQSSWCSSTMKLIKSPSLNISSIDQVGYL